MNERMPGSGPARLRRRPPIGIVSGGGSLPFAVADAAWRGQRRAVLFALRGFADSGAVGVIPASLDRSSASSAALPDGPAARAAGTWCSSEPWCDQPSGNCAGHRNSALAAAAIAMFRGGDDHLLSGVDAVFENDGFGWWAPMKSHPRNAGAESGCSAVSNRTRATKRHRARARAAARDGPFDVGQAAVVAEGRVLRVEAAEGTDEMLAQSRRCAAKRDASAPPAACSSRRPSRTRIAGSICPRSDHRPSGAAHAGLAGVAVVAGETILAEAERVRQAPTASGSSSSGSGDRADAMSGRASSVAWAGAASADHDRPRRRRGIR